MSRPNSRWKWALVAVIVAMITGMGLAFLADSSELRRIGIGIFVVAAAGYVAVRVLILLEKRTP